MSEEKKNYELKNEELSKVSGGHDTTLHKKCPFCNKTFHIDGMARYKEGEFITNCPSGHQVYYSSAAFIVKNGEESKKVY